MRTPKRRPSREPSPQRRPSIERIFVTITAGGSAVPPAERVLTIYPRYTAAETFPGPGGLTVLAFRDGTPYQGEDIIYDAAAPGFLVRCTPLGRARSRHLPLRTLDRDSQARDPLSARWLIDWRNVAGNIDRLIASLRPCARLSNLRIKSALEQPRLIQIEREDRQLEKG